MHWIIVLPYYFIATLALLPLLILGARLFRLKVSINALVGTAIVLAVAGIVVPLAAGWLSLGHLSGRPLLALVIASFLLAAIDFALARVLPLPLDDELREL